jgi:hypothetical protein
LDLVLGRQFSSCSKKPTIPHTHLITSNSRWNEVVGPEGFEPPTKRL